MPVGSRRRRVQVCILRMRCVQSPAVDELCQAFQLTYKSAVSQDDDDADEEDQPPPQRRTRNESAEYDDTAQDEGDTMDMELSPDEQLAKKLVRYALSCDFSRMPIRRDGIKEHGWCLLPRLCRNSFWPRPANASCLALHPTLYSSRRPRQGFQESFGYRAELSPAGLGHGAT